MSSGSVQQNVIAVLWDFDQTQKTLFENFGVVEDDFWGEVAKKHAKNNRDLINRLHDAPLFSETINYLNHILEYVDAGVFSGLNNNMLRYLGSRINFLGGVPEIFEHLKHVVKEKSAKKYFRHDYVEHYVVSAGLRQMILGSKIAKYLDGVWGCEFEEKKVRGKNELSRISYVLDDTAKTKAVFEIHKGINFDRSIKLNDHLLEQHRRVPINNIIYVADGKNDVPVFSVVKFSGGKGLVVYTEGNFRTAYNLHKGGRGNHFTKADYSEGSDARRWLEKTVLDMVD